MNLSIPLILSNPDLAHILQEKLTQLGHQVPAIYQTEQDALKGLKTVQSDLIVISARLMSKIDGIKAASLIRNFHAMPIIFLVSEKNLKIIEQAKWIEPIAFLAEPFEKRALKSAIEQALFKRKIEENVRGNREWLTTTLKSIGDAVIATDVNASVIFMNGTAETLTGWFETEAIGKPIFEIFNIVNEITGQPAPNPITRVLKEGIVEGLANHTTLIRRDGARFPIDDSGAPIRDDKGNILGAVLVFHDISQRREAEKRIHHLNRVLRSIRDINQLIVRAEDEKTVLEQACSILTRVRDFPLAWIGRISLKDQRVIPVAASGKDTSYLNAITIRWDDSKSGQGPTGMAVKTRKPFVMRDILNDPRYKPWRSEALKRGYHSSAAFPIIIDDELYGVLNVYSTLPDGFDSEEVDLLSELSRDLAFAVDSLRRKKREADIKQALRESEEKYRSIFENALDAIYIQDREGRFLDVNPAAEKMYGYPRDHFLGKTPEFVSAPGKNDLTKVAKMVQRAFEGEPQQFEFWGKRKNGEIFPKIVRLNKGKHKGQDVVVAFALDISEQRKALAALEESELRFRTIFQTSPDAISINELKNGIYLEINDQFTQLTGFTRDEIVGKPIKHLGIWVSDKEQNEFVRKIKRNGEVRNYEASFRVRTGDIRTGSLSARLVELDNRLCVISVTRDITEEKKINKQIRQLASVIEQASEAVVITDVDGNIEYVNPAFERLTGYSREEVAGKNPNILKSGKQEDEFYANLWRTITSGQIWHGTFINRKKDGSLFYEDATIFPVKDRHGHIINYAAVKRDITKERQLEEQLHQSQKLEAVGQLAGGVAHDFNNLLTAINGYSEMILMDMDEQNPIRDDVVEILKAGKRAADLTRQLLAFSRKQVIQPQIVNINTIISDSSKMLRRLIGEDVRLEIVLDETVCPIEADPGQIEQILVNLVLNARDAVQEESMVGKEKKITIETKNRFLDESYVQTHVGSYTGRHVLLAVSDSGVGMDRETASKAFEPFFTTKGVGKGTGLGLSTVYGIVKQNNGSIFVYSEPGEGTTFKIYWPCTSNEVASDDANIPDQNALRGNETLLIVEDEPEVRHFIRRGLEKLGYKILLATNGQDALDLVKRENPRIDLLFTDVIMPHMDGKELSEALQKIYPDLKILFASGYTDNHIAHRGVLDPGVHFIGKPYSVNLVAWTIRKLLDQKT
ncbi:MAG: PAS domain S-box protein [Calditrichaeota bacterium]|nr:PAS domain S-box protein [Calditrichota bacterium]